jgi:hypothetical protein
MGVVLTLCFFVFLFSSAARDAGQEASDQIESAHGARLKQK